MVIGNRKLWRVSLLFSINSCTTNISNTASASIPLDMAQNPYLNPLLSEINIPGPQTMFLSHFNPTLPLYRKYRLSSPFFRKWLGRTTLEPTKL